MKLTILVDNRVLQGKNLLGEHGFSVYIEKDNKKILFDTGCSGIFIKNANKMGIDLFDLDYIILSHGHYDHTGGLHYLLEEYNTVLKQDKRFKKPVLLAHPDAFYPKFKEDKGEIGCSVSKEILKGFFDIKLTKEHFKLNENIAFLGEIPRKNSFEGSDSIGTVCKSELYEDDYITEDSALVFNTKQGLIIVTGCSHSGICNIIEYAKNIYGCNNILDVIGGFHLVNPSREKVFRTADYLSRIGAKHFHPCHCTDFRSMIILSKYIKLEPTGVGLTLEYNQH